jgi:adenylate kinase
VDLLLLGPQGSGKGTQAARLAADYGIPHISTGEMFRDAIDAGTELGRRVEPVLAAGELVPDDLAVELIRERLDQPDARGGFVLDGFPRNLAQAEALDTMLSDIDRHLDAVFYFELPDAIAMERLLGRSHAEGRTDDTPAVIARRLAIYHEQTEPLVEYYRAHDRLVPLHAARPIDEVYAELQDALERLEGRVA